MEEIVLKTYNISKNMVIKYLMIKYLLQLKRVKFYGLIGKNGAGKTTLFRIITGLSHKSSGNLEMFGKSEEKRLKYSKNYDRKFN